MVQTIIRRLLIMIPQLFVIAVVTFLLGYLLPGDFVSQHIGEEFTWQEIQHMREVLGLDAPWYEQFLRWFTAVIQGDFGTSRIHHRSVTSVIGDRIMNTVWLSLATTLVLIPLSVSLGILAGRFHGGKMDKGILTYGFVGMSLPNIVLGLLFIWLVALGWGILPARGSIDPLVAAFGDDFQIFVSRVRHLILPVLSIALGGGIGLIYMLRSQIIDGKSSDYATTARSKGVPERVIFNRHILRNSLIPFATTFGFLIVGLFSGTIFIETIFGYPGMGMLFITSINQQDFPVANILILFYAILSVIGILLSDIALTIIDPRIRVK